MPSLAVVIPMFNEGLGADACVRTVRPVLDALPVQIGLIVVNDGSHDATGAILDRFRAESTKLVVVHQENRGYGGALISGAAAAKALGYDYVVFMDSDLTNPPEHVERFLAPINAGFDLIKASRFMPGGRMEGVPWRRSIVSRLGNLVARTLFGMGISDCTNGFRAIRTDAFLQMPLHERGFPIIMEELYWAKRNRLTRTNVPTILYSRSTTLRPTAFTYSPSTLWSYFRYALRAALLTRFRV